MNFIASIDTCIKFYSEYRYLYQIPVLAFRFHYNMYIKGCTFVSPWIVHVNVLKLPVNVFYLLVNFSKARVNVSTSRMYVW